MRIRYRVAIAVALLALISAGAWLVLSPREPSYDDKPLSYWISVSPETPWFTNPADPQRITSALSHIGSNALPTLSKMLRAHDSTVKLKFMELVGKQSFIKFHFVPAIHFNTVACQILENMRDQAVFAVPVLSEVYAREVAIVSNHPGQTDQGESMLVFIPDILGGLGPLASNAVPALVFGASCTNSNWRDAALSALGQIYFSQHGPLYVVRTREPISVWTALDNIQKSGDRAAPALPAVFALLQDTNLAMRIRALETINLINLKTDPAIAVPALTKALGDPNDDIALKALDAIKLYGPDAKSAVPAIIDLLHRRESSSSGTNYVLRSEIKSVLEQIDPAAARTAGLE